MSLCSIRENGPILQHDDEEEEEEEKKTEEELEALGAFELKGNLNEAGFETTATDDCVDERERERRGPIFSF